MKAIVQIPGTCGELVQGIIGEQNFLISFPVNKYSKVTVTINGSSLVNVTPSWCTKAAWAVQNTLAFLGEVKLGAEVMIESELPVAKGWASSSADILASVYGVAIALNRELQPAQIARLALAIEPTDGIFLPGLAVFDHVQGTCREVLGPALPIQVLALEFSKTVDTLSFNGRSDLANLNKKKESKVAEALALVKQGVREKNTAKLARGATISALAHQQILYKPGLEKLLKISGEYGAIGLNIAHSGTAIGLLFEQNTIIDKKLLSILINQIPGLRRVHRLETIGGGIRVLAKS